MRGVVTLLAIFAASPAIAQTAGDAAQQQAHALKALSAREAADLLAGRGMGLARAAELNHYPGPAHALERADQLGLTPGQEQAVRASHARMASTAKALGAELVERERTLDQAFRDGTITPEALAAQAGQLGALQGRLRAAHLSAHIETRAVLMPEQVAAYDRLQGHASPAVHQERHGGHAPG